MQREISSTEKEMAQKNGTVEHTRNPSCNAPLEAFEGHARDGKGACVCVCLLEEPIEMTPSIQDIQVVQAIRLRKSEVSTKFVQASCVLLVCPATSSALSSRALRMKPTQQTSGRCRTCNKTVHCVTYWGPWMTCHVFLGGRASDLLCFSTANVLRSSGTKLSFGGSEDCHLGTLDPLNSGSLELELLKFRTLKPWQSARPCSPLTRKHGSTQLADPVELSKPCNLKYSPPRPIALKLSTTQNHLLVYTDKMIGSTQ